MLTGVIVPQPGEQAVPFCISVQLTPRLAPSLDVVAVNCCVALSAMLGKAGDTETEMGETVISAVALTMLSAVEVAINNTFPFLDRTGNEGGVAGAM